VFERFTQAGRHVVILAQDEARRLRHGAIDSDHMLLAILLQPEYTADADSRHAADALRSLGVTLEVARAQVAGRHARLSEPPTALTLSDDAKSALEEILRAALARKRTAIESTDFLLGLVRKPELSSFQVLEDLGVSAEAVSQELAKAQ
jgi:ATP-dependent Clp protease ATP-binding subunit ClpA